LMVRLCRETGARVHIVHHSSAESLGILKEARDNGLPITVETCPHYLTFAAEEISDGLTQFKCCPPVRDAANREMLWTGLKDGIIDMVVSDHSPCPPDMKALDTGDFMQAWGGISSLQLRLPVMWTQAHARGISLGTLVEWLCRGPARLLGFASRKGSITSGSDADLVIWDPEESFTVESELLLHRHKVTPYLGQTLKGVVQATYVRGLKVFDRGRFAPEPQGRFVRGSGAA
jgi:allantoinase